MSWKFNSIEPIYLQIAEEIKSEILCGKYKMGERLPSVRDLAFSAEVNPNTVQRAFTDLESDGIITTVGTSGKFVTESEDVITTARKELIARNTQSFLKKMTSLGVSSAEIIEYLKETGGNDNG